MEVGGISGASARVFGVPNFGSITRASKIKSFKFYTGFENGPQIGLGISHTAKCYKARTLLWERQFQSSQEHINGAAPYKWPCKHACSLAVCSTSFYQRNDVEDVKSVEKKVKKDLKLPISSEVESLITTICDTANISEVELSLAGFHLYIKRKFSSENVLKDAPSPPSSMSAPAPESNASSASTSLAIPIAKPSSDGIQRILDTATDEGLVIIQSPKVGFFRRSRKIKGKRAPPSSKEKQDVKEGQVVCYVEQLGGEIPIESDVSGEVIKILRNDGEPVGYGDALIAILPSFPGIKKLQ